MINCIVLGVLVLARDITFGHSTPSFADVISILEPRLPHLYNYGVSLLGPAATLVPRAYTYR